MAQSLKVIFVVVVVVVVVVGFSNSYPWRMYGGCVKDVWRMYGGVRIVVDVEWIDGLHEEFMVRGGRMARVISFCDLYLMEK
jgi:hypothetical protein